MVADAWPAVNNNQNGGIKIWKRSQQQKALVSVYENELMLPECSVFCALSVSTLLLNIVDA